MKSHFQFTTGQRNGIFLLLALILGIQCFYHFAAFPSNKYHVDGIALTTFQREVDSLRQIAIENSTPKLYPFNPNFITDYKGYTLGMANEEIDRLHAYRKKGLWINSKAQFQTVTKISDSLLAAISPYFKFPEWVTNPKPQKHSQSNYANTPRTYDQKIDLNTATALQLQRINGIGEALSARIVKYRNRFPGGFIADVQLQDVYGLSPEVIERITEQFTVKTPRQIDRIDINTALVDDLVTIQHIDYELAHEIVNQRVLREGFRSLDELTKVKGFPVHKFEIIKLYLTLN